MTRSVAADDLLTPRCTKCHTEKVMLERIGKMPPAERTARLDTFLTKHFAPKEDERKAIIEALLVKLGRR